MADIAVQVSVPYYNGTPADVSTNVWHFHTTSGDPDPAQVGAFIETIYTAFIPYASSVLNFTEASAKAYDMADPEPRSPVWEGINDFGDGNITNPIIPEEVAVCLSFRGVLESGAPPARRRGRVYLGPLSTEVVADTGRSIVLQAFIDDMLAAYEAAWAELTDAGLSHCVWSPTDGVGRPVVYAWMDNAFDTQRRRGVPATSRTSVSGPF